MTSIGGFPGKSYWALCSQGLQDQALADGVDLTIRQLHTPEETQNAFMECIRQPREDVLILSGAVVTLTDRPARPNAPHTPIVSCDADPLGTLPVCRLVPDKLQAARQVAAYLVERLRGQGKIVHMRGFRNRDHLDVERAQGFEEALAPHPGITVVATVYGEFERANSAEAMQAVLAAHPDLHAVYAHSDDMALGASDVLQAAGRDDVLVVGFDAIPEALSALYDGTMLATVDLSPYVLGRTAMQQAVLAAQGQPVPPEILTEVRLVTKERLLEPMLMSMRVLPNVLQSLVAGHRAQQQLQETLIASQRTLIQELSTPIIPLNDTILIAPLIGTIDSARAQQITEALLTTVSARHHTQTLILDITGVAVIDTSVIRHLLHVAGALRLLGTQVLLVGIRPEIAQTIVQLGVDLSSLVTRSTLQQGLEYALARNASPGYARR